MKNHIKQQKGIALVMALMLLLVMSVMVAGFMLTITNEQKMGGNQVRYVEALNVAEAGISEVSARLAVNDANAIGEANNIPTTADWEARIVNNATAPENEENIYYYSSLLTAVDAGDQLPYTVSDVNGDDAKYVLSVKYKTNAAGDSIYYYDQSTGLQTLVGGPPFNAPNENSAPVWIATSTGMVGNVRRSVQVEVTKNIARVNLKAAMQCNVGIFATGGFSVCGHNHPGSLDYYEYGARDKGNQKPYFCGNHTDVMLCDHANTTECEAAGCLPSAITAGTLDINGNGSTQDPPGFSDPNATCRPIWEMLNCSDSIEMKQKYPFHKVTSVADAADLNYDGFIEFDCDVDLGNLPATDNNHHGIYWIKGSLMLTSKTLCFKGLLYTEGDIEGKKANSAKPWVLGALAVAGDVNFGSGNSGRIPGIHVTGNGDILYSSEAIQNELTNNNPLGMKELSWREVNIH